MTRVQATVRNGRLVVDLPTDLPEGEVVELVPIDELIAEENELSDEEREALHGEIDAAIAEVDGGAETVELGDLIRRLRAP